MSNIEVRIPLKYEKRPISSVAREFVRKKKIVSPGDVITEASDYMRGHGTFVDNEKILASVTGTVEVVNKLISVKPLKTRFNGEVGDVVVGRINEVGQKRWKVDTFSKLDSVLMLSSVNLPGGELRRRSVQDELMMRDLLSEGDLISAEVQSVFSDGSLSLHTRSQKYGKLGQGLLVQVSPSLVKRCKTHFHNLTCGISVIIGNNGYIWIHPDENNQPQVVSRENREKMARLKNCLLALADYRMLIFSSSLDYAVTASEKHTIKDLLKPEVKEEIVQRTRQELEQM
ncbi:exosome complex component RRP4-like [Xenia sp. Carnegie-2017]|uniref:exosome complex component RRP4-like n=1 Tax=Xenia sp. Carnegie-2017 TaxID=2897299 RepID=UPI001F03AB71|nr:exosome complex component RRP4-like [Xenia sp. Carnegie-2017]